MKEQNGRGHCATKRQECSLLVLIKTWTSRRKVMIKVVHQIVLEEKEILEQSNASVTSQN